MTTSLEQALKAPLPPRSPWQKFYGAVHKMRRRFYQHRAQQLPKPVISIGNLHWGGSGKTPLVAAIASHLLGAGYRPAILSRGYGSRGKGVRFVSRGEGALLNPITGGDEPVLLAQQLPGVAVVVCPNRDSAGRAALEELEPAPDIFLLDDGFSHLRLRRDLDLLAFPASDPFGGGRLPPSGRLREPLASSDRADAVILTGASSSSDGQSLAQALRPFGFSGPGFSSRTELGPARRIPSGALPGGARVLVVSAIARPSVFLDSVRRRGFDVADHLPFPDHHSYPAASLQRIEKRFHACQAEAVLTTVKDRVKLVERLKLPLAELPLEARLEERFFPWLEKRLLGR